MKKVIVLLSFSVRFLRETSYEEVAQARNYNFFPEVASI
jgi:hypothetical protein